MSEFSEAIELVRGAPTDQELAAVIALLEAAHAEESANSASHHETPLSSSWSRNVSQLRQPIQPGPGQWRGAYRNGLN